MQVSSTVPFLTDYSDSCAVTLTFMIVTKGLPDQSLEAKPTQHDSALYVSRKVH